MSSTAMVNNYPKVVHGVLKLLINKTASITILQLQSKVGSRWLSVVDRLLLLTIFSRGYYWLNVHVSRRVTLPVRSLRSLLNNIMSVVEIVIPSLARFHLQCILHICTSEVSSRTVADVFTEFP